MAETSEKKKGGAGKAIAVLLLIIIVLLGGAVAALHFDVAGLGSGPVGDSLRGVPLLNSVLPVVEDPVAISEDGESVVLDASAYAVHSPGFCQGSLR